jgi:hypothetical protein
LGEEKTIKKKATHPAQWGGLEGIEKRGGHWGNKKKKNKSNK